MTVRDLMRTNVITAEPEIAIAKLAELLRIEQVGSVVITEGNRVLGLVTDRDITLRTLGEGRDPTGLTAKDVMTEAPYTVDANMGVLELTSLMREVGVRRIPVTEGGQIAGIVTLDDVTQLLAQELADLAAVTIAESPTT